MRLLEGERKRMKKGFTLMEMLAVVLLVALVLSFAVPAYRAVRFDVRNGQARVAVKKLAEAVKNYRRDSRGFRIRTCFTPTDLNGNNPIYAVAQANNPEACMTPGASGVPLRNLDTATARNNQLVAANQASQLFACGYLSYKDFVGLPYKFCTYKAPELDEVNDPADLQPADIDCINNDPNCDAYFATAFGASEPLAGAKYTWDKGFLYVDGRMEALDTYED